MLTFCAFAWYTLVYKQQIGISDRCCVTVSRKVRDMLMEHPLELGIISIPTQSDIIERESSIVELVHPGDKFDNYEVFCRHLGFRAKTGNSRRAQVAKIKRQIEYHVEGKREIVIDAVLDTPKEKPMRASNSRLKDIDKLICYSLYNGELEGYITYSRLAVILGLVNDAFPNIRNGNIYFEDNMPFNPFAGIYQGANCVFRLPDGENKQVWKILIRTLAKKVYGSYLTSIKRVLNRLAHDGYIKIEYQPLAKLRKGGVRIAADDECILDAEREIDAFYAVNCTGWQDVYRKNCFSKFVAEKKKRISPYADYEYIYSAMRIIRGKEMSLSNFDSNATCKKLFTTFFESAINWKVINGDHKMIFLLNRFILPCPIWDYEMFELTWQTNMPRGITEDEWPQYLGWLTDRKTCKLPDVKA